MTVLEANVSHQQPVTVLHGRCLYSARRTDIVALAVVGVAAAAAEHTFLLGIVAVHTVDHGSRLNSGHNGHRSRRHANIADHLRTHHVLAAATVARADYASKSVR